MQHVGWFYEPIRNQAPLWMEPYYNRNINEEIISYVIPIKVEDIYIGVVGMDIALSQIEKIVSETSVYDSGYAFLADRNAQVIYHKDLLPGVDLMRYNDGEFKNLALHLQEEIVTDHELLSYTYAGVRKKATYQNLANGLRLVLTVPIKEIDKSADTLYKRIAWMLFSVIVLAIVFTELFTRRLVKPLIELNIAAKKIANGDFSVTIHHQSHDEVGDLAESFRQTTLHLKSYVSYINKLAYIDLLTGFRNKTSYIKHIKELDEKMHEDKAAFGVAVFDINDLKVINDTYGHVNGDHLIVDACHVIAASFPQEWLFRIGGDEFVAVLDSDHYKLMQTYIDEFQKNIDIYNADVGQAHMLSIAWGMAVYEQGIDNSYIDVFNRADAQMYHKKDCMKKM